MEMVKQIQDCIEDEADQSQQPAMDAFNLPLIPSPHISNQLMGTDSPLWANELTTKFSCHLPPYQIAQQVQHQQQLIQQDRQFQIIWANQLQEIKDSTNFKNHNLPLARIKKIMKADEDVKMIAAETLVLFSRACEMFILELTQRSWSQAQHNKRRTLLKNNISSAIANYEAFDFLIEIVPMEEVKQTGAPTIPENHEELNESIPCFYDPSRFGSFAMDMRRAEWFLILYHLLSSIKITMLQQTKQIQHQPIPE